MQELAGSFDGGFATLSCARREHAANEQKTKAEILRFLTEAITTEITLSCYVGMKAP